MIREPVVSGQFYPGRPAALEDEIKRHVDPNARKEKVLACVSPHAGYIYSGPVAGAVLSRIEPADTFVIMGPNHTGMGSPFSIVSEGKFKMPLGDVEIDSDLAKELLATSGLFADDPDAHRYEHSIEVQIPFLQFLQEATFKIVPIVIAHGDAKTYKALGKTIAAAIKLKDRKVVVIASSDMTHYEPHDEAKAKDGAAIEAILGLDVDKLLEKVEKLNISMCGYGPTSVALAASKELGATKAELVKYQTSGDTSGDYSSVVGYAGVIIM